MPPRSARSHRSESLYHLPLSSCVKRSPQECLFEPTLPLAHESWAPEATIRTIAYPRQIGGGSQRGDGCFPLIRPAGRRGGGPTLTDVNSLGDCARKLQRRCSRGADVRPGVRPTTGRAQKLRSSALHGYRARSRAPRSAHELRARRTNASLATRGRLLARIICVLAARGRPTGAPVPAADDGRHQFSLTRAHGSSPVNRVRRSHRSLRSASPGARTAPQSAAHGNDRRPRRHAAPPHVDSPPGRTVPTAPGTSASGHGLRHSVPRRPGNARRRGPVAALTHTYSRRPSTPASPSFRRRRPGSVRRC